MLCILLALFCFAVEFAELEKSPKTAYEEIPVASRYDNPNEIRDRLKDKNHHNSPAAFPDHFVKQHARPYNPMWADYCDPWHCSSYHKPTCGLNRNSMKFRWFQSSCHLILNNKCAYQNGNLKYDQIQAKFCSTYAMFGRNCCPSTCTHEPTAPICAASMFDKHVVLFRNRCSMDKANCDANEYDVINMKVCDLLISDSNDVDMK